MIFNAPDPVYGGIMLISGGIMCLKVYINSLGSDTTDSETHADIETKLHDMIWNKLLSSWCDAPPMETLTPEISDEEKTSIAAFIADINTGRKILSIGRNPITLVVASSSLEAADKLWYKVAVDGLENTCKFVFNAESMRMQFDLKSLDIYIFIDKKEYLLCRRQILGRSEW